MGAYGFPVFGGGWLNGSLVAVGAVLMLVGLVRLISRRRSRNPAEWPTDKKNSAMRALNERYDRGDLTLENYQERLRALDK